MSARFEELDWRETPLGEISLRRRLEPTLQVVVYEAKLGDEFLMSSLFTASEIALAEISLTASLEQISTSWSEGSALATPHTPS